MKRWKVWVAASALSMVVAAGSGAASAEEMMAAKPDYSKVDVMMKDGMDWVPLRQVAEDMGYTVTWNETDRSVTLKRPSEMGTGMMDKGTADKSMAGQGMADNGMADKSMTDKGMADNSMTDKGMMDKSMTDKGMTDNGMADKSMTDKGMMDKSMSDKGMAGQEMSDEYVVMLQIGSKKAAVNGKESDLTFAPVIWSDKTYVTKAFVESVLASSTTK
jgi:hypothetical protein